MNELVELAKLGLRRKLGPQADRLLAGGGWWLEVVREGDRRTLEFVFPRRAAQSPPDNHTSPGAGAGLLIQRRRRPH